MAADRIAEMKAKILAVVEKNGQPISKIANLAGISVATASKFCHILEAEKRVKIERFGDMKLVRGAGR